MAGPRRAPARLLVASLTAILVLETGFAPPSTRASQDATSPRRDAEAPAASPSPTEREDRRTETSRTLDNHDGTFTTEFSSDPIFYRPDGLDTLQPIELGFEPRAGADKAVASDVAPVRVEAAPATDARRVLRLTYGDYTIALHPVLDGAESRGPVADTEPAIDGPTADVAEVFPGVDLRVFARAYAAQTFLVVHDQPQSPAWTFAVEAPGLRLVTGQAGDLEFVDDKGVAIGSMPAPYAVDSTSNPLTGSGRTTTAVSYALGIDGDRQTVTVSVDDADWLAKAVYPVYVDPAVTIYSPGTSSYGDAHVNQGNPTFNYANYQRPDSPFYDEMWLGESPTDSTYYNEAFIKFDLASIAGTTIEWAELEVFPYHQYYNAPTATNTWLRRVTSTWAENTITWNTKPTVTTTGTVIDGLVEGVRSSFDITTFVQGWVDGTYSNHGLRLDENGNGATYWKRLISSEYGTNASPRLNITYHVPTATTFAPAGATTSSRTMAWTYGDPVGHPQAKYHVDVSTSATFSSILATSGDVSSANAAWAIPNSVALTPGTTYYWRVKASDGFSWSPWTTGGSFIHSLDTLGLQGHHRFESWDLGSGDSLSVNVATGNAVVSHPVVNLPIRGGSLPVGLTYNSHEPFDLGLGTGWRLNLQRRLAINADSTVTFTDADGGRHRFTAPVTNGTITTYTRPVTLYATLVKDTAITANEFTLTYRDQSRDRFDISGSSALLEKVEDRFGNAVTIAYSTGTNISTVSDPAGRQLTFTWDTGPTPDHLTQIQDWAYVSGGVVQPTATGARRQYRFFYGGSSLAGWADPLNTADACPSVVSHLTCLGYDANGLLLSTTKRHTQSTVGISVGIPGAPPHNATTEIAYTGGDVATITDAHQQAQPSPARTVLSHPAAGQTKVVRPGTPPSETTYGLVSPTDALNRVQSVWRKLGASQIEQRTTWNMTYAIEPATVTDNYGALLSTPARTVWYTYLDGSLGLVSRITEPLTASPATNRWTDVTYNANNDFTQQVVSQDGSATLRTTTRFCYDAACSTSATGLLLLRQIDNYVDGTAGGSLGNEKDVTVAFQYDAYGQQTRATRSNYDAAGALLDQAASGCTYDANGNLTAEIANYANGVVAGSGDDVSPSATTGARTDLTTTHGYDTAGNRISTADPRRAIETALGTSLGADDFVTRSEFDGLNQQMMELTPTTPAHPIVCPVENPDCREARWTYDELGLVRVSTDHGLVETGTIFDRVGRALDSLEYTPPSGRAVKTATMVYDASGRLLSVKDRRQLDDPSLGSTTTTYDELGRTVDVTEAAGTADATTTRSTYDALDRVVATETGFGTGTGQITSTGHDLGGRAIQVNDEFTCATSSFDYRDLELTRTEGKTPAATCTGTGSRTVTNTLDALSRLTRTEITASATPAEIGTRTVDVTLDAVGNTRTSAVGGSTTFTVNPLDQVITELRPGGATAKTTFDPAGNPVDQCFWSTATAESCHEANYGGYTDAPDSASSTGYDSRNQRISLRTPDLGETTYDPAHDYQVDAVYVRTDTTHEHQVVHDYDDRHRLTSVSQQHCAVVGSSHTCTGSVTTLGSDLYEHDDNDNRTRVTESNGATSSDRFYCHDARNQLVTVRSATGCASGLLETFAYDASGNRTSKSVSGSTTTYAFDAEGQLSSCSPTCGTIAYDAAGRTSRWNGWYLGYDAEGRLTSACKTSGCPDTADKVTMAYDGDGHRTSVVAKPANVAAVTTTFRYQGDAVVEESVSSGITRRFTVDEQGVIVRAVVSGDVAANNGTYVVTWNGHGDALALWRIGGSGDLTLANSWTYDTWGTPTLAIHNGVGDLGFRYLYVGRHDVQWDNQLGQGLAYMHARHYTPALGRFLQPDPARVEASRYSYAANHPVTTSDPNGTWNTHELKLCLLFAMDCPRVLTISNFAIAAGRSLYPRESDTGRGGAIRHCVWQCLLTREFGFVKARMWGAAHELGDPSNQRYQKAHGGRWSPDRIMDERNNLMGQQLGRQMARRFILNPFATAIDLCNGALRRHWLWIVRRQVHTGAQVVVRT